MFVLSRSTSRTPQTVLASTEVTSESGDCKTFNWASDNSVKSNYFCFSRHLRLNNSNKKTTQQNSYETEQKNLTFPSCLTSPRHLQAAQPDSEITHTRFK